MNAEENELKDQKNDVVKQKSFLQKVWEIIKKNPVSVVLLLTLIVLIIWGAFKINNDKKQFENDKTGLITKYELKIDSLELKSIKFSSKVFSWSVRSELLRKNVENLNQLFTVYVKESNANLVQLVNLEDNALIISTDKQYEGNKFVMPANIDLTQQNTVASDSKIIIYTPVMGFTNTIGLLIVEVSK